MSLLSYPAQTSKRLTRQLLFYFWLALTSTLSTAFILYDFAERYKEAIHDAAHARNVVLATYLSRLGEAERKAIIQSYANIPQTAELEPMNFMLVVNERGSIVYSSRPSWIGLPVHDPLLQRTETRDSIFRNTAECFRQRKDNCIIEKIDRLPTSTYSYTVALPIRIPSIDLGLNPRQMLILANYAPGVILADFTTDIVFIIGFSSVFSGLTALALWVFLGRHLIPKFDEASRTDILTGLINRGLFMEQTIATLATAEEDGFELVFAIADIDHFKRINDTFGHATGDAALTHVANIFKASIRPEDLLCRFGGEEFAFIISAPRAAANQALERLRLQLEMAGLDHAGHHLRLTASFGAVSTADHGYNIDYLYNSADKALYNAKESGRNRIVWCEKLTTTRLGTL